MCKCYVVTHLINCICSMNNIKMDKLLIVGAGATGTLTASILAAERALKLHSTTIWDKGSGVGGRMTTRRNPQQLPEHQIDMGAQYITRHKALPGSSAAQEKLKDDIFKELIDNNVMMPFTGTIEGDPPVGGASSGHYVCPKGMNAIPRYFLQKSKFDCHFRRQLKSININEDTKELECTWESQRGNNGPLGGKEIYKCIVLTIPVPQILSLEGNFIRLLQKHHLEDLQRVKYSSRYAMALGFDQPLTTPTSWTAKYFNHPIIRYASWDNLKRNAPFDKPSLLLHTSVPFGLEHLETDKIIVGDIIKRALPEVLATPLPSPAYSHIIRWRYSQVFKPYPNTPGCVVLHSNPLVIATGDAFSHSNLEGCIAAATSTVTAITGSFR